MPLSEPLRRALCLLSQAHDYAAELTRDPWDFAVEIETLLHVGLTNSDLRWLLYQGHVAHATEVTGPLDLSRRFQAVAPACFGRQSCFLLNASGLDLVQQLGLPLAAEREPAPALGLHPAPVDDPGDPEPLDAEPDATPSATSAEGDLVPSWCVDRRVLRFQRQIVKHFKVKATNQEIILATFEEDHWHPRIDDPLARHPTIDSKRRLHDTINSLNRNQRNRLIRFVGDGSGEGICWEPIQPARTAGNGHDAYYQGNGHGRRAEVRVR